MSQLLVMRKIHRRGRWIQNYCIQKLLVSDRAARGRARSEPHRNRQEHVCTAAGELRNAAAPPTVQREKAPAWIENGKEKKEPRSSADFQTVVVFQIMSSSTASSSSLFSGLSRAALIPPNLPRTQMCRQKQS